MPILDELVNKIVVHIPVKENGRKQMRIGLYFTCVRQIGAPLKIGGASLNESKPAWANTPVPTEILFAFLWDTA